MLYHAVENLNLVRKKIEEITPCSRDVCSDSGGVNVHIKAPVSLSQILREPSAGVLAASGRGPHPGSPGSVTTASFTQPNVRNGGE